MTDAHNEPDVISHNDPAAPVEKEQRSGKGKVIGGVAALAVTVAAIGGGAYAYSLLNSSGDYPYDHMAKGAFAYAQTNMDPSAGQKLAINELMKKFPELKDEEGYDVLTAENINAAFVAEAIGADVGEYKWVGDRVAIAAYPDNGDEDEDPQIAVLIETTDAAAAQADLDGMLKKINEGPEMTYEDSQEYNEEPTEPVMPEEDPNSDLMLPEGEGGVDLYNPDLDGDGNITPNEEEMFKQYLESQGMNQDSLTPGTRPTNPDADGDGVISPEEQELHERMQAANEAVNEANVNNASFTTMDVREEPEITGKIYDEKWVALTDGNLADYFETDSTLADDSTFTDRMDEVSGNVVAGYVNLAAFTDAVEAAEGADMEGFPRLTGEMVATVEVRKDGLDASAETFNVKSEGKVVGPQGDAGAVTELLEANAYEDAAFNLAIAGLGESVGNMLSSVDDESGVVIDEDVKAADVPAMLGTQASLSVQGDRFEELNAKLILTGVDETLWNEYLAKEGVTAEQLSQDATAELGRDFQFTVQDGELVALVGPAPEGGQDFENGQVTGSVNLDDVASIIHNFNLFGDTAEGEAPTGLGVVKFHANTDADGNGKSMLSWTTPR